MRLLLARHGNTFETGQTPLMVGARSDLELVDRGYEQAENIGSALRCAKIPVAAIYSSPLKRTFESAKTIAKVLGLGPEIVRLEPGLKEIDYGKWEGLSSSAIGEQFGPAELEAWDQHSIWPTTPQFSPPESEVRTMVKGFVESLKQQHSEDETILVVSSNGKLRYFLDLIPGEFARRKDAGTFKMSTGHLSLLSSTADTWGIDFWNIPPEKLASSC